MRRRYGPLCSTLALALLGGEGCAPAGRFGNPTPPTKSVSAARPASPADTPAKTTPEPLPSDYVWLEPVPGQMAPQEPIVFVHEGTDRAAWEKLPHYWNVVEMPPVPTDSVALIGVPPLSAAGLAVAGPRNRLVKVKVPLGLDDPTAYIPVTDPPTLGKWELGKRLFFDREVFLQAASAERKLACAGCHNPGKGYTDRFLRPERGRWNTPTLLNSVYNSYQFWDGRANALEEVVQRTAEDERGTPAAVPETRHVWSGVIERLRRDKDYDQQFRRVFGTPATQDAVGKAIATYVRTLLCGDSLHDGAERARKVRGGNALEARDYEKALEKVDKNELQELLKPDGDRPKEELAKELHSGYLLFHGKARCVQCHGGSNFTDNGFHNLGIADSHWTPAPGQEVGRIATIPIGLKDRRLIGAFKTPTLRSLLRTHPYFHDGTYTELFEVVAWHVKKATRNPYLDPEIRDLGLKEEEVRALVLFLKALNGEEVAAAIAKPEK